MIKLLIKLIKDKRKENFYFSNTLKTILEIDVKRKINFNFFDYYYTFDTCAILYLDGAQKHNKIGILESRGNQIDFALEINKKINEIYGTNFDATDNYLDNQGLVHWYQKLRSEPDYADHLIVYSEFHRKQFKHKSTIKIPIASNFSKSSLIKKYKNNKITFLFVGRIVYSKGIAVLLKAWEKLSTKYQDKNIELNIVGKTIKETEYLLNNLPSNIHYHGYLFKEELKKQFEKNSIFVFPLFMETYGMVIMEALAYNMPIITTSNCGAAEYIIHNETGYIYNNIFSETELIKYMEKFIIQPELINKMSEKIKTQDIIDNTYIERYVKNNLQKLNKKTNFLYSHNK